MKALVEYMRVTGLSQVELAGRIGVNPTQLSHWVNGRRAPSAHNLKLLSQGTGISLEKLVEDL
jgi:transcriptional regulator with XRE-family HTH domain